MGRLSVFNAVSIDGYFTDANGDMSWAHRNDDEWKAFARSLDEVAWRNTEIVKSDIAGAVRRMKEGSDATLVVLGSGSIVSQLTEAGLVDEYQIVLTPIVLGAGRTMFEGVKRRVDLELKKSRSFRNGNVVLWYEPRR